MTSPYIAVIVEIIDGEGELNQLLVASYDIIHIPEDFFQQLDFHSQTSCFHWPLYQYQ